MRSRGRNCISAALSAAMWLALTAELALLTHAPRTQATPAAARTRTRSQFRAAAAPAAPQPPEAQQPHTQSESSTDTNDTREGELEMLFMSGEIGLPARTKRSMVPSGDGTNIRTITNTLTRILHRAMKTYKYWWE